MSPEEVLNQLVKMGIKVSRSTLLRFEKAELIPTPTRGSTGRGVGRYSDYPQSTPEYFFASWWLIKFKGIKIEELSQLLPIGRVYGIDKNQDYCNEIINNEGIDILEIKYKYFLEKCDHLSDDKKNITYELYKSWSHYYTMTKLNIVEVMEKKYVLEKLNRLLEEENEKLKLEVERLNKLISVNPV